MFEIKPFPEFSWSNSRHKTFTECKKKYYFHYYLSHNGWLFQAEEANKQTYRLKNIKNLPISLGEAIHEIIHYQLEAHLAGNRLLTEQELKQLCRNKLNQAFIDSKQNYNDWVTKPKKFNMLHEIYYNDQLTEEEINVIKEKLEICINNLLNCKSYHEILTNENIHVLEAEELKSFYFDDIKVYVVLDFVFRDRLSGKWVIVDWKTGKETKSDRDQLALYALYLIDQFKINLEDIEIRNEYLQTGKTVTYTLNKDDIVEARNLVVTSTDQMRGFLVDRNQNKPLAEDQFTESFSFRCKSCNFKEKCDVPKNI